MFSFLKSLTKLSGAPPRAFQYYRSTKDETEKAILEDLYEAYDEFIKKEEKEIMRLRELFSYNGGSRTFENPEERKFHILSGAFDKLQKYGTKKDYPDFLISLFNQY